MPVQLVSGRRRNDPTGALGGQGYRGTKDSGPAVVRNPNPPAPPVSSDDYQTIGSANLSNEYIGLLSNQVFQQWVQSYPEMRSAFYATGAGPVSRRIRWVEQQQGKYRNSKSAIDALTQNAVGVTGYSLVIAGNLDQNKIEFRVPADDPFGQGEVQKLIAQEGAATGASKGLVAKETVSHNGTLIQFTSQGAMSFPESPDGFPPAGSGYYCKDDPKIKNGYNRDQWVDLLISYQFDSKKKNIDYYNDFVRKAVGLVGTIDKDGMVSLGRYNNKDYGLAFAAEVVRYHYLDLGGGGRTYSSYQRELMEKVNRAVIDGNFGTSFTDDSLYATDGDYSKIRPSDVGSSPEQMGREANARNRRLAEIYQRIEHILWNGGMRLADYGAGTNGTGLTAEQLGKAISDARRRGLGHNGESGYLDSRINADRDKGELEQLYQTWVQDKKAVERIAQMSEGLDDPSYVDYMYAYVGGVDKTPENSARWPWWEDENELNTALDIADNIVDGLNSRAQRDADKQTYENRTGYSVPDTSEQNGARAGSTEVSGTSAVGGQGASGIDDVAGRTELNY